MLLTLTTTHHPATDLGFLLRKNPARVQTFELPFGEARVFYPEAGEDRCTCALQVVVDHIGLVRKRGPAGDGGALEQYVSDRPYAGPFHRWPLPPRPNPAPPWLAHPANWEPNPAHSQDCTGRLAESGIRKGPREAGR